VKRVLDAVSRITGLELRREMAGRRAGDPPALVASGGRAAARLSWRPRRSLEDAVRDAWTWMQAHPQGYAD
jgi:UDP-glucose 4-epimerase